MGGGISVEICNCSGARAKFTSFNGSDGAMTYGYPGSSEVWLDNNECRTMKCHEDETSCQLWVGDLCTHCRNPHPIYSAYTTIDKDQAKTYNSFNKWVDGTGCGARLRGLGGDEHVDAEMEGGLLADVADVPLLTMEFSDSGDEGINLN